MGGLLLEKKSYIIRGAFFEVYKQFRDSQKESVCHNALLHELTARGLSVEKNKRLVTRYKGEKVGVYIPDLVVDDVVVIEIKCKSCLTVADKRQFWYYIKNSQFQLGFLVNFGVPNGVEIYRVIHTTKVPI